MPRIIGYFLRAKFALTLRIISRATKGRAPSRGETGDEQLGLLHTENVAGL
jgi:hypothetical protein